MSVEGRQEVALANNERVVQRLGSGLWCKIGSKAAPSSRASSGCQRTVTAPQTFGIPSTLGQEAFQKRGGACGVCGVRVGKRDGRPEILGSGQGERDKQERSVVAGALSVLIVLLQWVGVCSGHLPACLVARSCCTSVGFPSPARANDWAKCQKVDPRALLGWSPTRSKSSVLRS